MSDWRPGISRAALQARAELLVEIRGFFAERGVLEVDTPIIGRYSVTDPALEPLRVTSLAGDGERFLQTSPEFAMKRLLAADSGDIYQLGKVFRSGESGARHNPEFTMLEWYRLGFSLRDLMDEVAALVTLCLDRTDLEYRSHAELFRELLDLDPHSASADVLHGVAVERVSVGDLELDRDGWLDLLMSHCVEPVLKTMGCVFVYDYPLSQAALARSRSSDGVAVADRFELYVDGLELANGYRELLDPRELESRARDDNRRRDDAGREPRELDPRLLAAMEHGLPDCSGVALGVDRLLMLRLGVDSLDATLPFAWDRA